MITGKQVRAAMAGLQWSRADLAAKTGLSPKTIQRLCEADGVPNVMAETVAAVENELRKAGVAFCETGISFHDPS